MKNSKFAMLFALAILGLTGCEDKLTYNYLVQHPAKLKQAVENCQSSNSDKANCDIVMNAATNFMAMLNDQQQDQEKFGERLLQMQIDLVKQKQDYLNAKKNLGDLQSKNAAQSEIAKAQVNLVKAQKTYDDSRNEVKMMLAVLGVNSPE